MPERNSVKQIQQRPIPGETWPLACSGNGTLLPFIAWQVRCKRKTLDSFFYRAHSAVQKLIMSGSYAGLGA